MRKLTFLALSLAVFTASLISQPQYYNYQNVGSSSNTFPFGQSAGKAVNWLFLAGDFNQPTPAPAGNITKVYFYITTGGTRTFTNLHILMAQATGLTTLTTGQFYPGPWDTVYYHASQSLTGPTNGWMSVTLDTPYPYDPSKSLLVFVGQCGATGSGVYVRQNVLANIRRVWSVGGCPFTPYSGGDGSTLNFGFDIAPPAVAPEYLYYKFEDNPNANSTPNCAFPGVGLTPTPFTNVTLTPGGQFDSCITGTGLSSSGLNTGWNCDLGSGSWTISMWLTIPTTSSGSAYYLFGDAGSTSFRCFHNGVALPNNLVLRGPMPDVNVTGIGPAPTVVTFVYDSVAHNVKAYKNGVLANTVSATINMPVGTGFKVGGYSTSTSFIGKMDEFRLYRRALDTAEIAATWNTDIACATPTGVTKGSNNAPVSYSLMQNYPNPFNPQTQITFALPKAGHVKLVVFDILGREIATLVNGQTTAGTHTVEFDGSVLSSGVYLYKITAGDFTDTKKMVLVK